MDLLASVLRAAAVALSEGIPALITPRGAFLLHPRVERTLAMTPAAAFAFVGVPPMWSPRNLKAAGGALRALAAQPAVHGAFAERPDLLPLLVRCAPPRTWLTGGPGAGPLPRWLNERMVAAQAGAELAVRAGAVSALCSLSVEPSLLRPMLQGGHAYPSVIAVLGSVARARPLPGYATGDARGGGAADKRGGKRAQEGDASAQAAAAAAAAPRSSPAAIVAAAAA